MSAITQNPGQARPRGAVPRRALAAPRVPDRRSRALVIGRVARGARVAVAPITWQVFLASRLVVWIAGGLAAQVLGVFSSISSHFGTAGGPLTRFVLAPAVRWDAVNYLGIAAHGYRSAQEAGFCPLLPLLIRAGSLVTGDAVLAGVLIGLIACLAALETVRRLAAFEMGEAVGRRAVTLLAFGPMSLFLSAVYTDGPYLALSAAAFLAARRGRWARAGLLGGLSAATRPVGWLLVVPLLVLYLYGPRADRARSTGGSSSASTPVRTSRLAGVVGLWRPRYPLRPDVLWLAPMLVLPAAFAAYLSLRGYGVLATMDSQRHFMRHSVTMPWAGAWDGLRAGGAAALAVLNGVPTVDVSQALVQAVALVVVACAAVGTFRRLPAAYGLAAVLPLLVHLASPTGGDPLRGFARYSSLRFALFIWAAAWSIDRGVRPRVLLGSIVLLALFTAQFATWHMVGSLVL